MSGMWKRSHGRTSEAPPDERGGYRYVRPTATASHLDSTLCSRNPTTVVNTSLPRRAVASWLGLHLPCLRSAFHYSASPLVLRITAFGSEQFHGELWPNNATRLSRIDWLWSAKRASVWVTGGGRRRVNQEYPPLRIYIIRNDGIKLYREGPA